MTERRTPVDRFLDVTVFGPAGLAVTVAEEFPRLVEKGRQRVEGQVQTARLMGQFAVQMGRRRLEQTFVRLSTEVVGRSGGAAAPRTTGAPGAPGAPGGAGAATSPAPSAAATPSTVPESSPPTAGAGTANGKAPGLAIPGYDSLSASQVVQRLEGLSSRELEEVRAHETAHRQRRTILHRVDQLLSGASGASS